MSGPRRSLARAACAMAIAVAASGLATAPAVAGAQTFTGFVDESGPRTRTHPFEVSAPDTIDLVLDWDDPSADLNLFLKDPGGTGVARAVSQTEKPEVISYPADDSGTWKVTVKAKTGAASYTLTVGLTVVPTAPTYLRTIGGPGHADMYPSGVDVDDAGNVYTADTGDDEIQAYAPDGTRLWVTGSRGGRTLGRFSNPRDVAYLAGKVYVADTAYKRVQVLDSGTGQPIEEWSYPFGPIMGVSAGVDAAGQPIILVAEVSTDTIKLFTPGGSYIRSIGGSSVLNGARDAATDSAGTIYVADYRHDRMTKFGPAGALLGTWGSKGSDPGQFRRPYGVDVDDDDHIYVADNNERIQKFDADTNYLGSWGSEGMAPGEFFMLRRVAVGAGPAPAVYGADLWNYKIERFAQTGEHEQTYGGTPPADGFFNEPYGVAVDSKTFVMDTTNQRAQRFSSSGAFEMSWGERGWGEGNPGFNWARDIAIAPATNTVWAADTKNHRLSEFSRDGVPTGRRFGKFGSGVGQFSRPHGLVAYGSDLIVADTVNNRVQRWNPSGPTLVWSVDGFAKPRDVTVFGSTVYVADSENKRIVKLRAADGGSAGTIVHSQIHRIEGIAVEPNGDIWVSDTSWNRLVEFSAGGTYLQKVGRMGTGHGQFNQPAHLEILAGSSVQLFVADQWNDRIEVFRIG